MMKKSMTVQNETAERSACSRAIWLPVLLVSALLAGVPTTLQARDRGFNQPGAAGNRRGLRRR